MQNRDIHGVAVKAEAPRKGGGEKAREHNGPSTAEFFHWRVSAGRRSDTAHSASAGAAPVTTRISFRTWRRNLKKSRPISGWLGGTMASGAKIVWPIPDLINARELTRQRGVS